MFVDVQITFLSKVFKIHKQRYSTCVLFLFFMINDIVTVIFAHNIFFFSYFWPFVVRDLYIAVKINPEERKQF